SRLRRSASSLGQAGIGGGGGGGDAIDVPVAPAGPRYMELPNAKMKRKMIDRKIRPNVNPTPCPKLFDRSFITMIRITKLTIGMMNRISHHPGRPTTFSRMYVL